MLLHNRVNSEELKKLLLKESFKRITVSFYRYVRISDPKGLRDMLYSEWSEMNCFGRIYIAREGINAQMSIPEDYHEMFIRKLRENEYFREIPVRYAVEDDGKSFFKLTIKVRPKIVADGLSEEDYDFTNVGRHLSALEFHQLLDHPETLVVDMRNHYESEVGRFRDAICPDADTFREELELTVKILNDKKDKKILLYCTGGIRCEKASAYLKHKGFMDVNQLHGGILEYARQIKQSGLDSKFRGKNFVFDNRLGERITNEVISHCHQCGKTCDTHINCANNDCHLLFIQCEDCRLKYNASCSMECSRISVMPAEEQKQYRLLLKDKYSESKVFNRHKKYNSLKISE
jgi:UPF0176 protein